MLQQYITFLKTSVSNLASLAIALRALASVAADESPPLPILKVFLQTMKPEQNQNNDVVENVEWCSNSKKLEFENSMKFKTILFNKLINLTKVNDHFRRTYMISGNGFIITTI